MWNHTVPARDARVTRIRAAIPAGLAPDPFPLRIEARLTHRARSDEMMKMACDDLKTPALALQHLRAPSDVALDAALKWRTPDDGPRAKTLCAAKIPGCAQRRNPVPVYEAHAP